MLCQDCEFLVVVVGSFLWGRIPDLLWLLTPLGTDRVELERGRLKCQQDLVDNLISLTRSSLTGSSHTI